MNDAPETPTPATVAAFSATPPAPELADRHMAELNALLRELETATSACRTLPPVFDETTDGQLVQARLGMAASLFAAIQCKNAAVAGHALRVALACSAWAAEMGLPDDEREAIEVAALLHDAGVIAAPDRILLKPGRYTDEEAAVMSRCRGLSLEILRRGCASPAILNIVKNVSVWYDGGQPWEASGKRRDAASATSSQIPLGSRMIAIAEAFDAMITDQVYRPARSIERAIAELYECSGTQFDPELVKRFDEFRRRDAATTRCEAACRWLRSLDPSTVNSDWRLNCELAPSTEPSVDALFQSRLLDNMYDAVVFIDGGGKIVSWNRGAERLTGINGAGIRGQNWQPSLLDLCDEHGRAIQGDDCPVHVAIACGAQSIRRLTIVGRGQRSINVDVHSIPVVDRQGTTRGAILLFHDASSETSLEEQCQALHEKAIRDPLTQVANRAEFDRVHDLFIAAHKRQQVPCSLLMCDLDRFKSVNDTYGHQAGDDAIKSLASLLKRSSRPGDLVARYGGEEFVVLCADCDNATAARRAEQIRKDLGQVPQPRMGGRNISVSFGVTEIQPGDTPETMLRRVDRALLMAKARGRNTVVQLGGGVEAGGDQVAHERRGLGLIKDEGGEQFFSQCLVTPVPMKIAVEKLRGFVADHRSRVVEVVENRARLEIDIQPANRLRRLTDRPATLWLDVQFEEEKLRKDRCDASRLDTGTTRTIIKVTIGPANQRNRRRNDLLAAAREILMSFRSYLMAYSYESAKTTRALTRVKRVLTPWIDRD